MAGLKTATVFGLAESLIIQTLSSKRWISLHYGYYSANPWVVVVILLTANYTLLFLYSYLVYPQILSPFRKIATPKWFLLRIIRSRFLRKETQGQLLLQVAEETENSGILRLRELFAERLLLTDTSLIADVLVHHPYDFMKPENTRNFMRHFLGDGLIIMEGDRHKLLRKNTLQAFGYREIRNMYPTMWTKALALVDAITNEVGHEEGSSRIEIMHWASKVTMDVIGVAGLGHDFNLLTKGEDALVNSYEAVTGDHMLLYFVMSMWLSFEFVQLLPWQKNKLFKENTAQMKVICHRLIREKREAIHQDPDAQVDVLSHLINTESFSDDELADQLLTFLVAGHDTTSATLAWACLLLAQHPQWKRALQKEVREAGLPSTSEDASAHGPDHLARILEKLPILNGVLHETLRLYPTVPVTNRVAVRDTTIGTQSIPQGTEILISPWLVNRSPALWGDADDTAAATFDPQRWIDQDGRPNNHGGAGTNHAIQTFLHGPRSCLGQGFTKAELRCLLAAMAIRFDWTLDMDEKDVLPAGAITIRPLNGLYLRVTNTTAAERI